MERYKVTVQKTTIETQPAGQEWLVVGTDEKGKPDYGYTPEIEAKKAVTRTIYEQTIESESFNLPTVILAINRLDQQ